MSTWRVGSPTRHLQEKSRYLRGASSWSWFWRSRASLSSASAGVHLSLRPRCSLEAVSFHDIPGKAQCASPLSLPKPLSSANSAYYRISFLLRFCFSWSRTWLRVPVVKIDSHCHQSSQILGFYPVFVSWKSLKSNFVTSLVIWVEVKTSTKLP